MDLGDGMAWTLRPNLGWIPWWVLARKRRAPGTHATDHLALRRLVRLTSDATVAASLRRDNFYRRLVHPLAIAALNTPPEVALARLLGRVMRETLMRGGSACIAALPREGLSESLIDPAVAWLQARGSDLRCGQRVVALRIADGRVTGLQTSDGALPVEAVVLAVPPWVATELLPGLDSADRIPGDPQRPFPRRRRARRGRFHRPDRRHGGVGVRQARARVRYHQRRQPHGGAERRGNCRRGLAGRADRSAPRGSRCQPGAW